MEGRCIVHERDSSNGQVSSASGRLKRAVSPYCVPVLTVFAAFALLFSEARAQEKIQITVQTARTRQVFEGLGAGAIFYEGHITSLAARNKNERQEQLY